MSQFNAKERREDYALQVVPDSYRRWSWVSLFSVMLGVSSAMFFMAWGGQLVQAYGTVNLIIGMVVSTIFIGTIAFLLTIIASETGLDMDLITSGSGFGYKGAGITSLIYAFSFIIYFAMEGSIISSAIHTYFPMITLDVWYIVVGLIFIPLAWYGLTALNYVMWITLPIYLVLLVWSIILVSHIPGSVHFLSYAPTHPVNPSAGPALLQLLATCLTIVSNATAAADVGRFVPRQQRTISAIAIGYIMNGLCFLVAVILGAWMGLKLGQVNPGNYFPSLLGFWGVLFVVLTQIRINLLNTYCGSLALTTFFSRIFGFSPGRHWWVILIVLLSISLMFAGVLSHMLQVLTFLGVFIISWIMAVVSYLLFNNNIFKISPENFIIQKGVIPNYHPVGLSALLIALAVGLSLVFGADGTLGKTLAPFVSGILAFVIVPMAGIIIKTIRGEYVSKSI